jgi:hypothetical protein
MAPSRSAGGAADNLTLRMRCALALIYRHVAQVSEQVSVRHELLMIALAWTNSRCAREVPFAPELL